jgi:disulfide bond formation protein DsbB
MLENLPLTETFRTLVHGTAECSLVTWRFLSLSIPEWTMIFFFLFAAVGLIQSVRRRL